MQRKFLDYNTLQYTIADPRYAVSHHSDGYSGTAVRGGLLHRWHLRRRGTTPRGDAKSFT